MKLIYQELLFSSIQVNFRCSKKLNIVADSDQCISKRKTVRVLTDNTDSK